VCSCTTRGYRPSLPASRHGDSRNRSGGATTHARVAIQYRSGARRVKPCQSRSVYAREVAFVLIAGCQDSPARSEVRARLARPAVCELLGTPSAFRILVGTMTFTASLRAAANRHLEAAATLDSGRRRDVAGYLFGIAAECAIKELMNLAGIRDKEAQYQHFPELRTTLRNSLHGRNAQALMAFIADDAFMNNWHIGMRYADSKQIDQKWVDSWRKQAKDVVSSMNAK
jgi:hypothetical protein